MWRLSAGEIVDTYGNIVYSGSTRNFNNVIAAAALVVIAEAEQVVEAGMIDPNHVVTPGIFVATSSMEVRSDG
ncbi:hypothetical protein MASR2M79_25010 [Aminivibrio sp.]